MISSLALPDLVLCYAGIPPQVIEALAAELPGAGLSDVHESADAVTLETVRETLGAALDDEIRRAEGDDVRRNAAFYNEPHPFVQAKLIPVPKECFTVCWYDRPDR